MGNPLAYLMLAIWPVVCLLLFRRLKVERALIWSLLGGYLFLPPLTEVNLPLVPAMDKTSIPNLAVLLITMFMIREKVQIWPQSRVAAMLVFGFLFCAIPTVMTNLDPIFFEVLGDADPIQFIVDMLPGQNIRDIGSVMIGQLLMIVPFLLARHFLSSEDGLREILMAFMVGALIYSIPSLIEIRLSPQINTWVYGFFQHSFAQTIRGGGFRPIVFLPHGLWLALFVCAGLMAAAALIPTVKTIDRTKYILATAYLAVLLVLCKSLAAFAYGAVLTPFILIMSLKWQVRLAVFFGLVAVTYPMLRNFQMIPLDALLALAESFSADRAQSLGYRFNNEEQLLARAAERPLFGWSGWGRSLVRDPETAEILTIPDGRWIIVFGTFGWLGYICEMGLLALPLFMVWFSMRGAKAQPLSPYLPALCLILGITMMDMLLNATLTPLTWLTAGAILGHAEKRLPNRRGMPRYALAPSVMGAEPPRTGKRTIL